MSTQTQNTEIDKPKDETRELVCALLTHAQEDLQLAEFTASSAGYWHTAEDCRNARIAIEKTLSNDNRVIYGFERATIYNPQPSA